jgi:hypothetical protein
MFKTRSFERVIALSVAFVVVFALLTWRQYDYFSLSPTEEIQVFTVVTEDIDRRDVELVVASTKSEDTTWVHTYFSDWFPQVYVVDDPQARLTVPENKGREAMVYLTYIIDHYDELPNNVVFIHASRFAWHNDDPDYDAWKTLSNFQFPYLQEMGYVNLRCTWAIGCPSEIHPLNDAGHKVDGKDSAKGIFKQSFQELLPDVSVPEVVAVSCCSQFGVTRETILQRPKEDYVMFRDWILGTTLDDALSGRVFEFSWHSMF